MAIIRSDAKMKELILYVAKKSEDDATFGATKLNKILWAADFITYARTGKAITGLEYFRLPKGPALKQFLPIRNEMIGAGDCAEQIRDHFGHKQKRLIALREPDLGGFSGPEIAQVDEVLTRLKNRTAAEVSNWSHRFRGWEAADLEEVIPYETIFVSRRPLTETEKEFGATISPTAPA